MLDSLPEAGLDEAAVVIGDLFRTAESLRSEAKRCLVEAVGYYLLCGEALKNQKLSLKHGEWLEWLQEKAAVLGFGDRTARLLMRAAKKWKSTSDLTPDEAAVINREMWNNNRADGGRGGGSTDWGTPPDEIGRIHKVMGGIGLDPCSSEKAQETVKAKRYFSKAEDGLRQDWTADSLFMNPPYARGEMEPFVDKFLEEWLAGKIGQATVLTDNRTETDWWHKLAAHAAAFVLPKGRVKFKKDFNPDWNGQPHVGQTIFYFGSSVKRFVAVYQELGIICRGGKWVEERRPARPRLAA